MPTSDMIHDDHHRHRGNERPVEHLCKHGTLFVARADLKGGVTVLARKDIDTAFLAADFAQFGAWHAYAIYPTLNSFAGYDCVSYNIEFR